MGRQQRIYGSLIFCLFLSGEDGLWATPFGQGQSSPQPSTHQDPLWAPLPVLWWVLPVQAGFGLLSQFWTNLEITLQPQPFFFFFYFQPQYCHFLPFTLSKKKKKITVFEHFSRGTLERRPRAYRGCVLLLAYLPVLIFSLLSDCGFSFPSSSFQKRKFLLLLHFFSLTFDISLEYLGISGIFLFSFFWLHANSVYTWIFFFFFFLERGSIHFPQTFLGLLNPKILRTTDLK